jgi:hypothetical protein
MVRYPYVEIQDRRREEINELIKLVKILAERAERLEDLAESLIEDIRQIHSSRISSQREKSLSFLSRIFSNPNDPPCAVCGRMSDDILCPDCMEIYGWIVR